MKKLSNLYLACNQVYERSNAFKKKIKEAIPCLSSLEGNPFDRPAYIYEQPKGIVSGLKKGINPKAKAILEDILGKQAADEYAKEQEML